MGFAIEYKLLNCPIIQTQQVRGLKLLFEKEKAPVFTEAFSSLGKG